MSYVQHGTGAFRKTSLAFFAAGFTTFAILYFTQALMTEFSKEFRISPTEASLSLSVTTITLAFGMLVMGSLSEAWGRKPIMVVSLLAVSIVTVLAAFSPSYYVLLAFRIVQGIALAGVPAVAMAYLGEEIDPNHLGVAMGLYISGNSIGGMGGRIITGMLTDAYNWHIAVAVLGAICFIASVLFWLILPRSKHFQPRPLNLGELMGTLFTQCRNPGLLRLYGIGFLLMGGFVTMYNYIGYQLIGPPYSLSQSLVGWIFLIYMVGTFSSTWIGRLSDQYGRHRMMWISILIIIVGACMTLHGSLWFKIFGIAAFTFGFFGGHSIASSWVGRFAGREKAQASALYLFFYYIGSSIWGTAGGPFWTSFGWLGVVGLILALSVLAFLVSVGLASKERQHILKHQA